MAKHPHQTVDPSVISTARNISEFDAAVDGLIEYLSIETDVGPPGSDVTFHIIQMKVAESQITV